MPLERIYRDISINDSVNLDSFSKVRISEVSDYDFFNFTYASTNTWNVNVFGAPEAGLNFFTHYIGIDIVGSFANLSAVKFIDNKVQFKAISVLTGLTPAVASIQTRRLINITRNSTIKAYISFKLSSTPIPASRIMWIGIGNDNAVNNEDGKSGFIGLKLDPLAITATNPLGITLSLTLTTISSVSKIVLSKDEWEDRFDGTGPSGVTLDFTKIQVLSIEYRSGGHGETEWGFMVGSKFCRAAAMYNVNKSISDGFGNGLLGGTPVTLRPFLNSCRLTAGYGRTSGSSPSLTSNEVFFDLYGGVVFREENPNEIKLKNKYKFSTSTTYNATISSGISTSIIRIRKKASYNSATSTYFTFATIDTITFLSTATVPLYWELVYSNAVSTTFTSLDSNSLIEINTGTGALRPTGPIIYGGFVAAGETITFKVPESVKNMWQLVDGVRGTGTADNYTYFAICATPIGGGTTANQIRVTITTEET